MLAAVEGQPRAVEALRSALRTGSVHHAYLFGGPEGVGKELAAVGFTQALLCREKPGEGCGSCATCTRVERRNHPDVTWVIPEEEAVARRWAGRSDFTGTPSRDLKVEQVRGLQERLARFALESPRKVAVIVSAHTMNEPAQNALLKTLEEPPSGTTLILIASAPDKLLPTIRSRCAKVHFGPLPTALIAAKLAQARKLDAATAELVAVMAGGSLSRALEWDVEGLAARREVIERFEEVRSDDARPALRFAERFGTSREGAQEALRILSVWLRDLAVARSGGEAMANRDLEPLVRARAQQLDDAELQRREQLVEQALVSIRARNASPRMQLERLLLGIMVPALARETPMDEWIRRYE